MSMKHHQNTNLQTGSIDDLCVESNANGKDQTAVTVALSNHRCEMIPLAVAKMRQNDVVILEEPPEDDFLQLLDGETTIADYMLKIDAEYPEFNRRMYQAMRRLHRQGIRILQIEPYLEYLIEIHRRFGEGARPEDLKTDSALWPVYEMEHRATRALIIFYEASTEKDFEGCLETVKAFARIDARRFVLRDQLRAKNIALSITPGARIYVEAGPMHIGLAHQLRKRSSCRTQIINHFVAPLETLGIPGPLRLYGPGDILTLVYMFNPDFAGRMADLWAARALVQNKIIIKTEITDHAARFPHTHDEVYTSQLVQQLDLEACRRLLPLIDKMTSIQARSLVAKIVHSAERDRMSRESATEKATLNSITPFREANYEVHPL